MLAGFQSWTGRDALSQARRTSFVVTVSRSTVAFKAVLLFLLISASAPAMAQLDLRSILPGAAAAARREAMEAARHQQAAGQQQGCDQLVAWLNDGPLGIDVARQTAAEQNRAAMLLIEDGRFSRAFGKTFAQMSSEELKTLTTGISRCIDQRSPYWNLRGVLYTALSPQRQASNLRQYDAAKSATSEVAALTEELRSLQPTEDGYARLNSIRSSSSAMLKTATPSAVQAFNAALAEAQDRVAVPIQTARVRAAVASASGYDGLVQLSQLRGELLPGDRAGARDNLQAVNARMDELATVLATTERGRIDVLGTGMVGLERGVQWQTEFAQRYQRFQLRPLADVQRYFGERRVATLAAAGAEFGQAVRRATSTDQLATIQSRYLLPSDGSSIPGTQMLSALAEQSREIEKRAALGASLDQERKETAAAARTAAPEPKGRSTAAAPKGTEGGNGEPTQEAMYDLVRQKYEVEAQRVRELAKRCNSGRPSDPGDAIICLSNAMAGGVGADQPMKITRFEKLGCAPASGKPGYYCEFELAVTGGPTKFMGPITQSLVGGDGLGHARFLRRSGDWVMITGGKD